MSNSIWHTADEKPEDGATITFYLEDSMGSGDYDYDENGKLWFYKIFKNHKMGISDRYYRPRGQGGTVAGSSGFNSKYGTTAMY